ncbi:hypothetical protein H9Y05_00750 [Crocinitomicaceae bacterium CZZ-1]|uniref:Uncharacterized protein n=1 Tax=Taishania pollutisoli TaxID=2766479 RepID=A0A8J6P9E6_9FLAO|nr:hypothetical protein [Taishania pollutisoli]MBC9810993.1 hypothetical protein [Taishania pollutisoli]MBX2950150.1 hypothetical protein [Crocinitomicaceae bacterium]
MKKSLLALVLCASQVLFGQLNTSTDFTYTVSNPYKVVDGSKYYFSKDNEILSVKYGRGVFTFQKFGGNKMNEIKRVEVDKTSGFTTESYEEINGKFYFFYSVWDKEATTEQLFVREIDFDGCKFIGEGKRLIKVNGKVTGGFNAGSLFGFGASSGGGKFHFTKSYDDKKMIIQYRKYPESKNDNVNKDVIGMHVYDFEMNEVWSGDIRMPYTEKRMNNLSYSVDSDGNTYILSEIFNDDLRKRYTKEGEPNYSLELIKISPDETMTHTPIKIGDKFTDDVDFFEGKNGELVVAGFYGNSKKGGIDGFFLSKLQGDNIADVKYYEVPVDVMKMYLSDRAQEKMEKKDATQDLKMTNMLLREITYGEDGGITIYGEKHYVVSSYNPQTKTTTYTYYYQEIIGAGISADGDLRWMKKFPKNQVGGSARGGMGYYLITSGETDYLLFLDNINNIQLPMNQFPKAHRDGKGGIFTGFKVDRETGETEKISLFDTRDAKGIELFQFNTGRIVKVNDKTFSVECYKKGKEDVMVTIIMD